MRPLALFGMIAMLCGLGFSSHRWIVLSEPDLQPFPNPGPSVRVIGFSEQGAAELIEFKGALQAGQEHLTYALREEAGGRLDQRLGPQAEATLRVREYHRSRNTQTLQLTVSGPQGVTVVVYEGGVGLVRPMFLGSLSRSALSAAVARSLKEGLAVFLLVFVGLAGLAHFGNKAGSPEAS